MKTNRTHNHKTRLLKKKNMSIDKKKFPEEEKLEVLKSIEIENKYSNLIHSLPVAFYTCDTEGTILLYNTAAAELWGQSPEIGKDKWCGSFKIFNIDGSPVELENCPMAIAIKENKKIDGEEFIIQQPNGRTRNVIVYPSPTHNSAGYLTGAANVIVDITEKRAIEALYHKANKLARLGSWEFDLKLNTLYWSEITKEIHEVPADFEPNIDMALHFYKEGKSRDTITKVVTEAMQYGNNWDVELEIVTFKNNTRWVRAIGESRLENGECISLSGSFQDIDDRKRAESELRKSDANLNTIFSNIDTSLILLDNQFNVISCNRIANIWAKHAFGSSFNIGESLMTRVSEDKKELADASLKYVLSGASIDRETQYTMKNGSTKWYRVTMNPIKESKGAIIGICLSASDITEKKHSEQEILQKNEQLKNLTIHLENVREEERTIISKEIHDELGQQLTALKMDIDWIKYKQTNPDEAVVSKLTEMIQTSNELVNSMIRISSNLRPAIIDDLGLVDALQWKCKDFEKKTGIACSFSSDIAERPFDKKFSINVYRILQETLTNVVRHSKATAITISVNENATTFFVEINDNGIGISEENILNSKTLGILGMKERVELLKGELIIKGVKNKGTKTILILPKTK